MVNKPRGIGLALVFFSLSCRIAVADPGIPRLLVLLIIIILKIYAYVIAAPRKLLVSKRPVHLSTCNRSPMGKQCANS